MIRIAICDDEPAVCSDLKRIISSFRNKIPESLTMELFYNGRELVESLNKGPGFDLIFLDVALGDMKGFEIGDMIRRDLKDKVTQIAYITSTSGYEKDLFNAQPIKFLPKPLDPEEVFDCMSRELDALKTGKNTFLFKTDEGEFYRIPHIEIIYFTIKGRKLTLLGSKSKHKFNGRIGKLEKELSEFGFFSPCRSFLINLTHVKSLIVNELVMSDMTKIHVSRRKCREIRRLLADL